VSNTNNFDDLIEKLPKIAEVINTFTSEEVQKLAFTTVLESLGVEDAPQIDETRSAGEQTKQDVQQSKNGSSSKKKRSTKSIQADRKLNLRPQDGLSFADFVEQKKPSNNDERNVAAVYYLVEELGQRNATVEQVMTCYEDRGWRQPNDIVNSLQITSSKKHWLDSGNREAITLNVPGKNYVKHDMSKTSKVS